MSGAHPTIMLLLIAYFLVCCATAAMIDLRTLRLPNAVNLLLFLGGLAFAAVYDRSAVAALFSAIAVGAAIAAFAAAFHRWRGRRGLGGGDVKFIAACTPWLGLTGVAPALMIASLAALTTVLAGVALGWTVSAETRIPFGPFLALGAGVVLMIRVSGAGIWIGVT